MNDLLYTAAVVAPGAFNDVTSGGNMSSFIMGGTYSTLNADGTAVNVTPTGYGYDAGPGYDLVRGWAAQRALAGAGLDRDRSCRDYRTSQPRRARCRGRQLLDQRTDQSLLFQTMSGAPLDIDVAVGSGRFTFASDASDAFAWTSRFAQQVLQPDFDPALIRAFDQDEQGA